MKHMDLSTKIVVILLVMFLAILLSGFRVEYEF